MQNGPLRNLASLLIRRTDLAGFVRHFTFHDEGRECMWAKESEDGNFSEDLEQHEDFEEHVSPKFIEVNQAFKTAVDALSLSKEEEKKWLRGRGHPHRYHYDMVLALLFPALLKLEKLVLNMKVVFTGHYLERVIRRAALRDRPFDIQPPYQALTDFASSYNMFTEGKGIIGSLLKLPAIKGISGSFWNSWDREFDRVIAADTSLIELDSSSSSLINLDLDAYALNVANLGYLLGAPKALQTFFYMIAPPACINFEDVRHALRPQQYCLESLGFDCSSDYVFLYGVGSLSSMIHLRYFKPMTSFISFQHLKIFRVAALFLITTVSGTGRHNPINIFPPSPEILHLTVF